MVETSSDIDSALSNALREVNDSLLKHRNFAIAIQEFQKQLLQDLKVSNSQAQSYLAKIVNSMESALQSILVKIASAVHAVEFDINGLRDVSREPRLYLQ